MMILVVGATGRLGGSIARKLLAEGSEVRILVRGGSSCADLVDAGAQPVPGDLKDPTSLRLACAGVETVVTTANSMARAGRDTIEAVDRRGNQELIQAADAEHVRRFVFVSALGADPESAVPLLRAKGVAEQRLTTTGMTWTILQPNLFMDLLPVIVVAQPALAGKPVTLVAEGRRRHSLVAMRDVVSYVVAALEHDEAQNQRLVVGGPEPVSWRDVVAAFEHALRRQIPLRSVAIGEPVPGMTEEVSGLLHALETYDSPLEMTALAATYGVKPTPLAEFVRDFLRRPRARLDGAARTPLSAYRGTNSA
jgi:uncharacterized protein YbjT (DUF2867 family)